MAKRVLDVGNCAADHAAICSLIRLHFTADVVQTHGLDDTLAALRKQTIDLVLVNRKLDRDYGDGLEIIRTIKTSDPTIDAPVMMLTNFEEHQDLAVDAGAVRGFGKAELNQSATVEKLRPYLM